jgi:hypothetical protein
MVEIIRSSESAVFVSLGKLIWPLVLRVSHDVVGLNVMGDGLERFGKLAHKRTIICPSHPTSADGDLMFLFSRLVNENFHYVAASEIFRSLHGLYGWLMKLAGCHAVNRGRVDYRAYMAIRRDIIKGTNKIVMFPEGEISHQFDSLMPLEPGAAHFAFWALDELVNQGIVESMNLLPVALSYAYLEDPRYTFDLALDKLEEHLGVVAPVVDQQERLHGIVGSLVSLLEDNYGYHPTDKSLDERLARVRQAIFDRMCTAFGITPKGSEIERAHILFEKLDRCRQDTHGEAPYASRLIQERKSLASLLVRDWRRLMNLRFCLARCQGPYGFQEIGEALYLLELEVLGESLPSAKRMAVMNIGNPIDLQPSLALYRTDRHAAVRRATSDMAMQLFWMQAELAAEVQAVQANHIDPRSWNTLHHLISESA